MKNEELTEAKRIFNTTTTNGMREMTENRYLQAIQEFMEWQAKNLHKPHDKNPAQEEKYFKITNSDITRIPLTKELILRFGFKEMSFTDGSEYLEIDKTDYSKFGNPIHANTEVWKCYRFQYFKDEWYLGVYKDPKSNQYFVQKKIDFVHQLQNLYFVLTDEELTFLF